jgi:hypothetical protein
MSDSKLSYKEMVMQEYIKCSQDPVYFMKKYYYIQHPQRGRILFNLYPFQEAILRQFQTGDYYLINKSRQLGISTLISGFGMWLMLFHKDKNILVLATTHDTAKNLITKVRFSYDCLPSWLKVATSEHNQNKLKLKNGSQIVAKSATENASRSEAVSLLVIDEAAFIERVELVWTSAQQTLATGGQCIALSSPNGTGNWFYSTWVKSQNKENKFIPLRLPWTVHPERDQAWRDEQDKLLGKRHAAQECDADFITSGESVIETETITWYKENFVTQPIEKRGIEGALWLWEFADLSRSYMIVADVARGDGSDYSAFHIIDIEDAKQVGEFKYQISPKDFSHLLYIMAIEYNNALIVIENNSYGWEVLGRIIDRGYNNIYHSPKIDYNNGNLEEYLYKYSEGTNMTPGFAMSLKTRPLVISKLISYINDKSIEIKSSRTIDELRTFIWKNGKPQSQSGHNDDLVISLGIALFLRETSLHYQKTSEELSRASLNGIQSVNYSAGAYSNNPYASNPYKMDLGHAGTEDLNWLLG